MPTGRAGSYNIQGIVNPGPYVINNLPQPVIAGVPTNIEAMVGVGSWGPVNSVIPGTKPSDCAAKLGVPVQRFADIATHVSAASQLGGAINYAWVRVTDGTDTAAQATIQTNCGFSTAKHTGALGNNITLAFNTTGALGAYAAVIQGVGGTPERFDNIFQGLQGVTVTPGSGYTYVPAATVSAPQKSGGTPATVRPTLVAVGVPAVAAGGGGSGHAVNDVLTLGAGVQIKVSTVTGGAITAVTLVNPGSITSGAVPPTVGAQTSTTGSGAGANFTLSFGLGTPQITSGSNDYAAQGNPITLTLTGGGAGNGFTAGSYVPVASFWAALASAINNGNAQRGPSDYIVYTPGSGTAAPAVGVAVPLTGGTDGAGGVGTAQLIGVDGTANTRTGMYALRGSGMDSFQLCDCVDDTSWGAMTALAIQESAYAIGTQPISTSIEQTVATRQSVGQDDPAFKLLTGDWPTFSDSYFGPRLVSPVAICQGIFGNLSPEQSPINKPLNGVIATQTSTMGVLVADADEAIAQTGGVDVIGKSSALGVTPFTFLTGRNTSSNNQAAGDEYTRLTNFLVKAYLVAGRQFVGRLQSTQNNDPTRTNALQTFDSFCQGLVNPSSGSGGYGLIDGFLNVCDGPNVPGTNNPLNLIQRGYLFLTNQSLYLNVVRFFVVNLFGGGNVAVTVLNSQAETLAQINSLT